MKTMGCGAVLGCTLALLLAGCEGEQGSGGDSISQCGGFLLEEDIWWDNSLDYCTAERLHWKYEEAAGRLRLANTRVSLNCCGLHSISAAEEAGTWVVTETDEPGDGRCRCMCVYDFAIDITGLGSGTLPLRLVREVTDSSAGPETVLSGSLDLTHGSGAIPIDETPSEWCQ